MDRHQRAALNEVLRWNARLSAAMSSKTERLDVPLLRDELNRARVILAFERGLAQLARKAELPGPWELTGDQVEALFEHLNNRRGMRNEETPVPAR